MNHFEERVEFMKSFLDYFRKESIDKKAFSMWVNQIWWGVYKLDR